MGQVYQATDTNLDRQVAIKVLPDAFSSDPDRLARFEREAKVLASLNHPNIGAIYGLEKSGDTWALLLKLVEGPTLADRIEDGAGVLDLQRQLGDPVSHLVDRVDDHPGYVYLEHHQNPPRGRVARLRFSR